MHQRVFTEKQPYHERKSAKRVAYLVIVCLLHALLWTALYIVGGVLYITVSTMTSEETILIPAVVTAATAVTSISYIVLHNAAAVLSRYAQTASRNKLRLKVGWLATIALRLIVTMWLISGGLNVTFTLARYPTCSTVLSPVLFDIDVGVRCVISRSITGASLFAALLSLVLFVITYKTEDPFRSHLLGVTKEQALLPLMLPHKTQMYSEMSFKYRSSTSLSSHILVTSNDSTSMLLPAKPDKVVGLGIYAPKSSAKFLTPRPSLSSIRTHTTIGTAPPWSPLPPLPAYFPEKYRSTSAMHKAVYPPRRPPRPERSKSDRTVRIVPPSLSLSFANLQTHNKSVESLSSVYSRSISGERRSSSKLSRPATATEGSRSYSSGSTATIIKSPLGAMRLAEQPDIIVKEKSSRMSSTSSTTEIDDVVTLHAKLPSVKAVSDFGEVQTWDRQGKGLRDVHVDDRGPP